MKPFLYLAISFLLTVHSGLAVAQELNGKTIMQKVYDRDRGKARLEAAQLTLVNPKGETRLRENLTLTSKTEGLELRLIRFTEPKDINRTTFLNLEKQEGDDDQYLYLPAYKQVRKISSSERSRSFMGTDYTYEDILTRNVEADEHRFIKSEELDGRRTYLVESIPKNFDSSAYGRMLHWVLPDSWVILRSDFYDQRGLLQKRYQALKLIQSDPEKIWVVQTSVMKNLLENHQTTIDIKKLQLGHPEVEPQLFTVQQLERRSYPEFQRNDLD